MPTIYFVTHPMNEPHYGRKLGLVRVPWNTGDNHFRKFIKRKGKYLNDIHGKMKEADLYFWGEYEPPTDCDFISRTTPKAIHHTLHPVRGRVCIPDNAINTDPYVFGNHFKNICCGIRKKNIEEVYKEDDVIIFGQIIGEKYFWFDTVLVINKPIKINHTLNTTQYYNASIKPLIKARSKKNPCTRGNVRYFYQGKMFSENTHLYSFVPVSLNEHYEKKPILDLDAFGTKIYKQGFLPRVSPVEFNQARWNKMLDAVKKAGLKIGIQIDKI